MGLIKTFLMLVVALFILTITGLIIAEILLGFSPFSQGVAYSTQAASSTVYVQNGVSGVVTLTDPLQGKTVNININYDPLDSGSGVIVSNNGYIITAFHVIGDPTAVENNQLEVMSSNDVLNYVEDAAVTSYISQDDPQLGVELLNNNTSNSNFQMNTNNINTIVELLNQENLIKADSYEQDIKVKLPSTTNYLNASLVDVGDPNTDEDVALLKINANNLPALSINSQQPTNGESLRIYGYPGNSTQSQYDQNSTVIPSSSAGNLQSEVTNNFDTVYYESSATATSGYSGGPVVDSQNNVLGIIIYSLGSDNGFRQNSNNTESSAFLSSQYLIQICNENNVHITED
ncbi:MAG: trypsin-like peptidase domain-containing protein [Methanobacterium sp.]|jgi:S1-C subfamily serine protease